MSDLFGLPHGSVSDTQLPGRSGSGALGASCKHWRKRTLLVFCPRGGVYRCLANSSARSDVNGKSKGRGGWHSLLPEAGIKVVGKRQYRIPRFVHPHDVSSCLTIYVRERT